MLPTSAARSARCFFLDLARKVPMLMKRTSTLDLPARFARLKEIDWDFPTAGSQSLFSSLHWHPCRYPSQVPAVLIGALTSSGETVLDPFLGSGTTSVEAQRLGRRSIGVELNPIAALISRAKTINKPASRFVRMTSRIKLGALQSSKQSILQPTVQGEKWYTDRTLKSLRRLRHFIDNLKGDKRLLADTAFLPFLLPVCRETRHWGYVCETIPIRRETMKDVLDAFENAR